MGKTLLFPEWRPDLTELGTGVSPLISGVYPRADGYGPFPSIVAYTNALPSACRGACFARNSDGSVTLFAGTSTRLYKLNATTFTWEDVSKGGSAYTTMVDGKMWDFAQYNDVLIAVQVGTAPQAFTLSSSSAFADLGGSPPQAANVTIIGRFVFLSGLLSNPRRIQWCDLDAITTWTAGVGLADYQDLPDGGLVKRIAGGDAFGVCFQEDGKIRSLVYAPGSATVFQINVIATNDPLFAEYSVISVSDKIFYCSAQGFKKIEAANSAPVAIGKQRIDHTFFEDVDTSSLYLMRAATDPNFTRIYWSYKSIQGNAGLFDKALLYDWTLGENGRFTVVPMSGEFLATFATPGVTLEGVDPLAPTQISVTGAANNGSGKIRLTLSALSNADFNIVGQNFIVVQGVTGTTEANGTWAFTVIDSTHIDLVGSTFSNAYVSGGKIGGSLDALNFSLDSIAAAALPRLAAFDSSHKLGFFSGANVEAILETDEKDGEGTLMFVNELLLLSDSNNALCSIGYRDSPQDAVEYTTEQAVDTKGKTFPLIETRYARARVRISAGSTWSWIRGIQPEFVEAGSE